MAAKLREYWEKLPKESLLATILDPHLKANPLAHESNISRADSSRILKNHMNILKSQAVLVANADPSHHDRPPSQPSTPKKRKDAWEEFMEATDITMTSSSVASTSSVQNIDNEVRAY